MKFSHDDHYVYSTGGLDKCVMVWKTDFGTGEIILEEDNHEINHDNNLI